MKAVVIPVTPYAQNSTVMWCEETMKGAVSDPGGDVERLQKAITDQDLTDEKFCSLMAIWIMRAAPRSCPNVWAWLLKGPTKMICF